MSRASGAGVTLADEVETDAAGADIRGADVTGVALPVTGGDVVDGAAEVDELMAPDESDTRLLVLEFLRRS